MPSPATPKPWLILQAIGAALAQISVAGGYRTNIGGSVSLERAQNPDDVTEAITLYSSALSRPDEANQNNAAIRTRDYVFIIEAAVPLSMNSNAVVPAHQRMHDIIEDIEQALTVDADGNPRSSTPSAFGAIPPVFSECVFFDRPNGLRAIVAQYIMVSRYRR